MRGSLNTHLVILGLSFFLMNCSSQSPTTVGQNPPSKPAPSMHSTTAFNPIGDLLSQAQNLLKAIEDPSPEAKAISRVLILHERSLSQNEDSLKHLAELHFKFTSQSLESEGVSSLARSKLIDRFQVTTLSDDEELPINLDALNSSSSRLGVQLSDYKGLTFISYQGQALKSGLQIRTNCQIAIKLADSELLKSSKPALIVSLSTFEVNDLTTYITRCADPRESWVRPMAELEGEQVRLVTRGLNQWGRPELELGPLSKSDAPKHFPLFMKTIEAVRSTELRSLKMLKTEDISVQFTECIRPPHHYDQECRRLVIP